MQPVVATRLGRIAAVVTCLLWGAFAVGCAGPQKVLGPEGATCTKDGECSSGLTCKASLCTPLESRVGQVCVTAKGCAAGLACLGGRCSTGAASPDDNARACEHLRGLMEIATRGAQARAGEPADEAQLTVELDAFALECRTRFDAASATVEKVACIEAAKTLEQVKACP